MDFWASSILGIILADFHLFFRGQYTARDSRIGFWTGLKAASNQLKKWDLYWCNTNPIFLIDFRRFEPAQKPIVELRTVYTGADIKPVKRDENRLKRTPKTAETKSSNCL